MATLKSRISGLTNVRFSDGSAVYLIRGQTYEFNEAEKEPVHVPEGVLFTPDHVPHVPDLEESFTQPSEEPQEAEEDHTPDEDTPDEENASEEHTEGSEDVRYDLVDLTDLKKD